MAWSSFLDISRSPEQLPNWAPDDSRFAPVERLSNLGLGRRVFSELCDTSSSWWISFVIHLIAFLLIASFTVPWKQRSSRRGRDQGAVQLTMGFADRTESTRGEQVTLQPAVPETSKAVQRPDKSKTEEAQGTRQRSRADKQAERSIPERKRARSTAKQDSSQRKSTTRYSLRVSRYSAILSQARPSPMRVAQRASESLAPSSTVVQRLSPAVQDPQQERYDQIVDEFIEYDVGRLRGRAGQAARQRFSQLGEDAVPALVRGLNKSASIRASCPVGVIAGKLMTTLRQTDDLSLRQYAIDNVGKGVPQGAPHHHRLVALRKKWLDGPEMPPPVARYVQRMQERSEGELMELMLALSDSSSDIIVAALRSDDEYLAGAAVLAVIQSRRDWSFKQKEKLRSAVDFFASRTHKKSLRNLARDAKSSIDRS